MKIKICAVCGRVINEDEDTVYTINEGTDREYIECEQCHDQEWEVNAITNCEGCGRWFSTDILQSEEVAPRPYLLPLPCLWQGCSGRPDERGIHGGCLYPEILRRCPLLQSVAWLYRIRKFQAGGHEKAG